MTVERALSLARVAQLTVLPMLISGCAQVVTSPFGATARTVEVSYIDAPNTFVVEADGLNIGSIIAGTILLGPLFGGVVATGGLTSEHADVLEVRQLLTDNRATVERLRFAARVAADVGAEIERNGWAKLVGVPTAIAPDADAVAVARTTSADVLLIVQPQLIIQDRARVVQLKLSLVAYQRGHNGVMLKRDSLPRLSAESPTIDGKRTPPKTMRGQILGYGGTWLADDAARLRAAYAEMLPPMMNRAFNRLRDRFEFHGD